MKAAVQPRERASFSGSYSAADVQFLLTPIRLALTNVSEKERLIQSGRRHYSEMLSPERPPTAPYWRCFEAAMRENGPRLAQDVARLASALAETSGREVVLASLARAGTPVGVLLKRALERRGVPAPHYSISIIRDRGVDEAALRFIAERHDGRDVVFVDGWTGKGVIARELRGSTAGRILGAELRLVVVADPAGAADLAATAEDYVIPSGLLNGVVSGLVSRSVWRDDLVARGAFHGCVELPELAAWDVSRRFVGEIAAASRDAVAPARWTEDDRAAAAAAARATLDAVAERYGVADRNRIKPGVAETTRALLRRVPERLLLRDPADAGVAHLMTLAAESGVPVERLPTDAPYRAVAIIRGLGE